MSQSLKNIAHTLLTFLMLAVAVTAKEKPLTIGMELSNPPFETLSTKGDAIGISVDIAKELGIFLGRDVDIENIPFVGLIPSLRSKKIDLILSSMTPTFQRKEAIAFTDPYLAIGLCLLINKDISANNAEELNQKPYTIVVKTGTTGQQYAHRFFPNAKILALEQATSCISEVVQGKASAFFYDQLTLFANWKKYPMKTKVNLTPLVTEYWAIGLRKEEEALKDTINVFLSEFADRGGFESLSKKYLQEQQKAFKEQGVRLIFSPKNAGSS